MLSKLPSQTRNRLFSWIVLGMAGVATALRQPLLLVHPRFWAEEGTLYFSGATCLPWYQFIQQPAARGYYRLYENAIALLAAALVPLEHAPLVTTIAAFGVQMIPSAIVLTGNSPLFRSKMAKLLLLSIILLNIYTGEVWLNTTNSQVYLLLSASFILVASMERASPARTFFYRAVLVLAGLSAATTIVLAPLFVIRSRLARTREHTVQAIIALLTALFQIVFFVLTLDNNNVSERFAGHGWLALPYVVWSRILITPIAGVRLGDTFATLSREFLSGGPVIAISAGLALATTFLLVYWWLVRPKHDSPRTLAAFAGLLILGFTLTSSAAHGNKSLLISPLWSPRYFFVPSVLFLTLVLSNLQTGVVGTPRVRSGICAVLLALALLTGASNFAKTVPFGRDWPDWRQEVSTYRRDPAHNELNIWPPGWTTMVCDH